MALAKPSEPLTLRGWALRVRKSPESIVARYRFEFQQGETMVYEGEQTAIWTKVS